MILLKNYLALTKPGIVRGNAITAAAGFFLASLGSIDLSVLVAALIGLSLIIASACVCNNYLDKEIDRKMKRTKDRALATGAISDRSAIVFGLLLGALGAAILETFTNTLTLWLALFGFFAYVAVYGLAKRKTVHGTVIGSISGAIPPVVGYTAVANNIDTAAVILFIIVALWQMPHFYAIALYRAKDYAAAGIPVLPLRKGIRHTKIQILLYIIGFTLAGALLGIIGPLSIWYVIAVLLLGSIWFYIGIKGFRTLDTHKWARQMFLFSLVVISVLCLAISLDASL